MTYFSVPIFGQDLKCRILSIIKWLTFTLITVTGITMLIYNLYTSGLPDFVKDLLTSLPDEMRKVIYMENIPDFSNSTFNYAVCMQVLFLTGCGYACYLGCSAFQVSQNNGTVRYIHSLPISRTCVVITRFFSQTTILIAYNIVLICVSIWIGILFNTNNFMLELPTVFGAMITGQLLFLAIGFSVSCIVRFSSTPYTLSFGILFLCLIIDIINNIFSSEMLSSLVITSYYSPYGIIMKTNSTNITASVLSIIFCIISIVISTFIYKHKEL